MSSHTIEGSQSVHHSIEAYTTPSKPVDENPVQQVAQGVFLQEQSCASNSSEQFVFSKDGLPNEAIYRILFSFIESLPPKEAAREIAQKALLSGQWKLISRTLLTDCINTEKLSFRDIGVNTTEKLKCFLIAHGEGLRNLPLKFLCIKASEVKELVALCPNLESLSIRILGATDSTLKDIATLKKLTHLDLKFNVVLSISRLQDISTLENLTHLGLDFSGFLSIFPDDGVKEIAKLKKLTYLSLQTDYDFTNNVIKEFSILTELTHLNIKNIKKVTDEAMKDLVKLSKLEWLSLYGCNKLTDNGMKYIGQLTNLTHLGLRGAELITDEAVKEILKLRKLESLDLSGCLKLGDETAAEIATLTDLKELFLPDNGRLTDNGIAEFVKLSRLEWLDLRGCEGIGDASARSIGMLKSLKILGLSGCYGLTSAAIEEIIKLKNLEILEFNRDPNFEGFDDAALELIVSNLTKIRYLLINGWRPSDDMARRLVKLPKLQGLSLGDTDTISNAVKEEIKAFFKGWVSFQRE